MPSSTYALRFVFVDPAQLAATGYISYSTVRVVSGLVTGTYADLDERPLSNVHARLVDKNLIELGHKRSDRARIEKKASQVGTTLCYYCARCGRKFASNNWCKICNISFRLRDMNDTVIGGFPPAPPSVFEYLRQQGYRFKHRVPRV